MIEDRFAIPIVAACQTILSSLCESTTTHYCSVIGSAKYVNIHNVPIFVRLVKVRLVHKRLV